MRKKKPILKPTELKVLMCIKELNEHDLYPLSLGVYKILNGVIDEETKDLKTLSSFESLISLSLKRTTRIFTSLQKKGFIINIYDENTKVLYNKISSIGEEYLMNNKLPNFIKKKRKIAPSIVKIVK